MRSNQLMLDVLANNLANVNTAGYKADGMAFTDILERQMVLPGHPDYRHIGSLGSGTTIGASYKSTNVGEIKETGRPLDVALTKPNQFFAVAGADGRTLYTRDGSFTLDRDGGLMTAEGLAVLDQNGTPITVGLNFKEVRIDESANVLVDGNQVAALDVREGTLQKIGGNLWTGFAASVDEPQIMPAALEGSNVNAVETMIQMISVMRSFESAQKAIQTQDEATGQLIQSLAR